MHITIHIYIHITIHIYDYTLLCTLHVTIHKIKHDFCIFSKCINAVPIDLKMGTHIDWTYTMYHANNCTNQKALCIRRTRTDVNGHGHLIFCLAFFNMAYMVKLGR